MTPFLAAQAADPFDPAPMLIQADWLEERGDLVGAGVLRSVAESGAASMILISLDAQCSGVLHKADADSSAFGACTEFNFEGVQTNHGPKAGRGHADGIGRTRSEGMTNPMSEDGCGTGDGLGVETVWQYGAGSGVADDFGDASAVGDGHKDGFEN